MACMEGFCTATTKVRLMCYTMGQSRKVPLFTKHCDQYSASRPEVRYDNLFIILPY